MSQLRFFFLFVFFSTLFLSSCQERSEHLKDPSSSTNIDTTQWLKETRGIRDILEDQEGNLWFASPDYIARFDGKRLHYFSEQEGLSITGNLHQDAQGKVWVENGTKVFKFTDGSFQEERIDSISGTSGLWYQRGLSPSDTMVVQAGLYEVRDEGTLFHPYPIDLEANYKHLYFPSTGAHVGNDSTVWVATMEKVFGYKEGVFTVIGREEMGRQKDERNMGIRGIFIDRTGKLWMADNGAGVFVYDGKETINFTQQHELDEGGEKGPTLHRAFSIAEDDEGNMWFGTVYSGIWCFSPQTATFRNFGKSDGVKSENIWTIYKTSEGELLFAGESPGAVYIFDGNGFIRRF